MTCKKKWNWTEKRRNRDKAQIGVPRLGKYLRNTEGKPTKERRALAGAINRCYLLTCKDFSDYGGRGITVCDEWRDPITGFDSFMDHIGYCPTGHTLDRIDHNGNYEPGNVRWIDWIGQANNRRSSKKVTVDGVTKTCAQWAKEVGLPRQVISNRLNRGWDPKSAISIPKASANHKISRE